eukprot:9503036-Alexandrium_andersonii.AAC.1
MAYAQRANTAARLNARISHIGASGVLPFGRDSFSAARFGAASTTPSALPGARRALPPGGSQS